MNPIFIVRSMSGDNSGGGGENQAMIVCIMGAISLLMSLITIVILLR